MNEGYDYLCKLVLLGTSGVGKSNIVLRFVQNKFNPKMRPTVGVEFTAKVINSNGQVLKAQIWDTAGRNEYRNITSPYYRGALGAILVYDITNKESFESVRTVWLNEMRENADGDVAVVLVGNKTDLEELREVPTAEARAFAKCEGFLFCETSALKTEREGRVPDAFRQLLAAVAHQFETGDMPERTRRISNPTGDSMLDDDLARVEQSIIVEPSGRFPRPRRMLRNLWRRMVG